MIISRLDGVRSGHSNEYKIMRLACMYAEILTILSLA